MKTAEELFERLKTDEVFAKEFGEALTAKREAGAKNYYETIIPAGEERGYAVTKEDIDAFIKSQDTDLSEDELGRVAGGSCALFTLIAGTVMVTGCAALTYVMSKKQQEKYYPDEQ